MGPIQIGIPVLADQRLPECAVAFGMLMSGFAGGNLVGFVLAAALPRPNGNQIRVLLIALLTGFGVAMGLMGFFNSTWIDFGLMALLGLGTGYVTIILFTSIQTRTPKRMLGRIMSLLMLSSAGLMPISQALSGAIITFNLSLLFTLAGVLIVLVAIWTAFQPGLIAFSETIIARS